jgi:hypothetical protein
VVTNEIEWRIDPRQRDRASSLQRWQEQHASLIYDDQHSPDECAWA